MFCGLTLVDMLCGLTLVDMLCGLTLVDMLCGLTLVDILCGSMLVDMLCGLTLVDMLCGLILVDMLCGSMLVDILCGSRLVDILCGSRLVDILCGSMLVDMLCGCTHPGLHHVGLLNLLSEDRAPSLHTPLMVVMKGDNTVWQKGSHVMSKPLLWIGTKLVTKRKVCYMDNKNILAVCMWFCITLSLVLITCNYRNHIHILKRDFLCILTCCAFDT